jgi:hypothetical protein
MTPRLVALLISLLLSSTVFAQSWQVISREATTPSLVQFSHENFRIELTPSYIHADGSVDKVNIKVFLLDGTSFSMEEWESAEIAGVNLGFMRIGGGKGEWSEFSSTSLSRLKTHLRSFDCESPAFVLSSRFKKIGSYPFFEPRFKPLESQFSFPDESLQVIIDQWLGYGACAQTRRTFLDYQRREESAEFDEAWGLAVDSEAVIFGGQKAVGCRFDLACELQLDKDIEACKNENTIEEVRRCMQAVEPSP